MLEGLGAEMQGRCNRDAAEMQPRCGRDAGEMHARSGGTAGTTPTNAATAAAAAAAAAATAAAAAADTGTHTYRACLHRVVACGRERIGMPFLFRGLVRPRSGQQVRVTGRGGGGSSTGHAAVSRRQWPSNPD
eukprot:scaffold44197_cov33-Phaeocystis_antarctica.AAC.1